MPQQLAFFSMGEGEETRPEPDDLSRLREENQRLRTMLQFIADAPVSAFDYIRIFARRELQP